VRPLGQSRCQGHGLWGSSDFSRPLGWGCTSGSARIPGTGAPWQCPHPSPHCLARSHSWRRGNVHGRPPVAAPPPIAVRGLSSVSHLPSGEGGDTRASPHPHGLMPRAALRLHLVHHCRRRKARVDHAQGFLEHVDLLRQCWRPPAPCPVHPVYLASRCLTGIVVLSLCVTYRRGGLQKWGLLTVVAFRRWSAVRAPPRIEAHHRAQPRWVACYVARHLRTLTGSSMSGFSDCSSSANLVGKKGHPFASKSSAQVVPTAGGRYTIVAP